jgi:hypothetical protein
MLAHKSFEKTLLFKKTVSRMLVTLTTLINFINIEPAAFAPIFLRQTLQSKTVVKEKL